MSCGISRRRSLDPVLLWLWRRPVATAPIKLLAWEPPCAWREALEKAKRPKKKLFNLSVSISSLSLGRNKSICLVALL